MVKEGLVVVVVVEWLLVHLLSTYLLITSLLHRCLLHHNTCHLHQLNTCHLLQHNISLLLNNTTHLHQTLHISHNLTKEELHQLMGEEMLLRSRYNLIINLTSSSRITLGILKNHRIFLSIQIMKILRIFHHHLLILCLRSHR